MLDLHLAGDLQAAQGQGGNVMVHYPHSSADPEILWQNPANFNSGGATLSQSFTPPAGATEMQLSYQITMDKGWLAFSEAALSQLRPEYTITRKSYRNGCAIRGRIIENGLKTNFFVPYQLNPTSVCSDPFLS
jgi:hypothetical protein